RRSRDAFFALATSDRTSALSLADIPAASAGCEIETSARSGAARRREGRIARDATGAGAAWHALKAENGTFRQGCFFAIAHQRSGVRWLLYRCPGAPPSRGRGRGKIRVKSREIRFGPLGFEVGAEGVGAKGLFLWLGIDDSRLKR